MTTLRASRGLTLAIASACWLGALSVACSDDDTAATTPTADSGPDVTTGTDGGGDVTTTPDVKTDTNAPPDTGTDTSADTEVPDAAPDTGPDTGPDAGGGDPEAGATAVTTRGCKGCHKDDLSGGNVFGGGQVHSANLTPDTTGLGEPGWTDALIERAILHGIDKDGVALCAPMKHWADAPNNMTDQEAANIVAYLHTIAPVVNAVPASSCSASDAGDAGDASDQ